MRLLFLSFVMLCFASSISAQVQDQDGFFTRVGEQVVLMDMQDIDGHVISLESLRGKTVLLSFFGTNCGPCRQELPLIKSQLQDVYPSAELEILVVGPTDDALALQKFEERYQYKFTYIPDELRAVFSRFAEYVIPRNVVLDRAGRIVYQSRGYSSVKFEKLLRAVEASVKG